MKQILNMFRSKQRRRMEQELERELKYHLERRVQDLVGTGIEEKEARRAAAIEFGGVAQVQEEVRETWIWRWLDGFLRDARYAVRSLTKSWGFTLGTIAMLALGVGAVTAIFSVVNTVLLKSLPYPESERIVAIETLQTETGQINANVSGADFVDVQTQNSALEAMAHSAGEDDMATVVDGHAEFVNVRYVSSDFFAVFGAPASAGRLLSSGDSAGGQDPSPVAVVSRRWAESHFGSAGAAIGKSIKVYERVMQIVGVAAPGFRYPDATDLWAPDGRTDTRNRAVREYLAVGKLKRGIPLAAARAQMRTIGDRLAEQYPENKAKSVSLTSLQAQLTGGLRPTLWALMGAVSLVLLIACANIANLLVARSAARTQEIAVRAALGAGRGRVVQQLLTECFVLAGIAAAAGLLIAYAILRGLVAISPPNLPRVDDIRIDLPVLLFAMGVTVVSTVMFGLIPALQASRLDLAEALKQGGSKGQASGEGGRLRAVLVTAEIALSVVLLASAGLLLRSFQKLQQVDLGFTTERMLVAYTQFAVANQEDSRRRREFYKELMTRVRALPGVQAAAGAGFLPLGKELRPAREYSIPGQAESRPGALPTTEIQVVTSDYFKTLGIALREGRDFNDGDVLDSPRVAVINETLARASFPGESPIGRLIQLNPGNKNPRNTPYQIIGVAASTRWRDPSQSPPAEFFTSAQQGGGSLSILARTTIDEKTLGVEFRKLMQEIAPSVPIRVETMEELFSDALTFPRFRTQLIGVFAAVALLLAAVGIFSVLAYLVGQRTREFAVRIALGASGADVVRLVVNHGLRLIVLGLALGLAGSLAIARLLEKLLYQVTPWDFVAYLGAVIVLGMTALVAILLPALKASAVDPLIALRNE